MSEADPRRATPPSLRKPSSETENPHSRSQQIVQEQIHRKGSRRLKAKSEMHNRVWFGLGMFGLIGWSVTIPTLIGTAIGVWLDAKWEGKQSWTLMLLFLGLVIGCLNAWRWMKNESEIRDDQ